MCTLDKLPFPVRTGKLKCSTEKLATGFIDGLLDPVFTLFCDSAFVLLYFIACLDRYRRMEHHTSAE